MTVLKSLGEFLSVTKYLILFNFLILGVKIDANILSFLEIHDYNLIGLNLQNTVIIHSLINNNNFSFLVDLSLIDKFTKKINSFTERQSETLNSEDMINQVNSILERVYESKSFYMLENHDILLASSKSSGIFKETRKLLEGI